MMLALAALVALPLAALPDQKDVVEAAAKKILDADSYSFKGETSVDSAFGNLPAQIPAFEGKFQKEVGLLVSVGDRGEFFRKGDKVYVKQAQGEWTELEKAQFPGAGGPGGGQNRQRGALMGRMFLRNIKAPHEELKDLAKGFKDIKKDDKGEKIGEKECAVYGGDLTEEAVKASPIGRMIQQFAAFGGGGQGAELSGKGRVWVDPEGVLLKAEFVTKISLEFNGNPIEVTMTRSSEFSALGKTKVELPEGLKKRLEAPPPVKTEEKKDNN
jgi:hypothetical protein